MITLSLLKWLEDNGLGEIDKDLFHEKMGLGKVGVYIASVGGALGKGARKVQNFELFCRGRDDLDSQERLIAISEAIVASAPICNLPAVPPYSSRSYCSVEVEISSTPTNLGQDENGRLIYSITGLIYYKEKK